MKDAKLPKLAPGETADVAFLLEGTYPYVSGGVSSWVHEIISGLPEVKFSLIFLGSSPDQYGKIKYQLPKNVVHIETHFLMDRAEMPKPAQRPGSEKQFDEMEKLHDLFRARAAPITAEKMDPAMRGFGKPGQGITEADFFYSEASWERIRASYEKHCTDPSFVDYFWTVRTMHAPLFTLAKIAENMPPARVVHAVSTGYAGFLGSLIQRRRGIPFVLTEHGIYTKERRIDLAHATWIKDAPKESVGSLGDGVSHMRWMWIRFFEGLGRMAYAAASPIVSLYEGNRERQVADGAQREKTHVIPNGVDVARFEALVDKREPGVPPVVGLIGRVVPIKDIRTFIRAMKVIAGRRPEVEGWIIGPHDEDKAYAQECRDLVTSLGLEKQVKFLGFKKPDEVLPKLGLSILTSISEALPLVVLESYAAGVPVVATDVGSCRELVEGKSDEDRALGSAGAITPIATADATAEAALRLLGDPVAWKAAQQAGRERVRRYYTRELMFASYRSIYETALEESRGRDRVRAS